MMRDSYAIAREARGVLGFRAIALTLVTTLPWLVLVASVSCVLAQPGAPASPPDIETYRARYGACQELPEAQARPCFARLARELDATRRRLPTSDQSAAFFLVVDARTRAGEMDVAYRLLSGAELAMRSRGFLRTPRGRMELAGVNYRLVPVLSARGRVREAALRYAHHVSEGWVRGRGPGIGALLLWIGLSWMMVPAGQGTAPAHRVWVSLALLSVAILLGLTLEAVPPLVSWAMAEDPFAYQISHLARWRTEPFVICLWVVAVLALTVLCHSLRRAVGVIRSSAERSSQSATKGLVRTWVCPAAAAGVAAGVLLLVDPDAYPAWSSWALWNGSPTVPQVVGLGVVSSVLMEKLFRGALLDLAGYAFGPLPGMVAVGLAYAVVLGGGTTFALMFMTSTVYAAVRWLTGSVWAAAVAHVAANVVLCYGVGPTERAWM